MNSFFSFFRGEWTASIFLLFVIFVLLVIGFFRGGNTTGSPSISPNFSQEVLLFYEEQNRLDSLHSAESKSRSGYRKNYYSSADTGRKESKPLQPIKRRQLYDIVKLNINLCDSIDVLNVPQFGAKRAQKLIEYRDQLGGFTSFGQVREVYILQNIEDELLQKFFYIDLSEVKRINVNKAEYKELASHPYLDGYLAKLILNYRERKGPIRDLYHFQEITNAYAELVEKLEPYLEF